MNVVNYKMKRATYNVFILERIDIMLGNIKLNITELKTEYMEKPLGIDVQQPRLSWAMISNCRNQKQTAYQVIVASTEELLESNTGNMWDTGKIESDQSIQIEYKGKKLESQKRYYWKVRVWDDNGNPSPYSEKSWWEMGLLNDSDWNAQWICMSLKDRNIDEENDIKPAPFLRKEFALDRPIKCARAYVTALGLYEMHINGKRVGANYLTPGWTDYNKRIQYQTYDVTEILRSGTNALGAILGEGWYSGNVAHVGPKQYGDNPALFMQINIEYEDGSTNQVISDESWKCSTGPIIYSDLIMGETHDARKEIAGWDMPGFNDSNWPSAHEAQDIFNGILMAQAAPAIKITQLINPISVSKISEDTHIVDMGQNMVGWVRLNVKDDHSLAANGGKITLRFAEVLNPDGTIYTENLRTAKQTDTYITKGEGSEIFEPYFTFHGFRYIEIKGYPGTLCPEDIKGCVVHSDTPLAGTFQCSNSMVNKLYKNITWGQRGNFISIPTDCPQRNERMGWTGDAQIFVRTASYNMDVAQFFTKWMIDVEDAQFPSGAFTDVAPQVKGMGGGNAAWGDAGVIVPWTIYKAYGDMRIIKNHYNAMTKWIDYLKENSEGLLRPDAGFGDWLSINADTPKDVLGTAYFAYSTKLLSEMAQAIGRHNDAEKYRNLFEGIKGAFNKAYVDDNGTIKGDTQTCYVLALHMDLLSPDMRRRAAQHLVNKIEEHNWHLTTGFLGVGYLLPVLANEGYVDVAYRLLLNDTFPSWGYSIKHGATTIWEHWDGWTEHKGFQDPRMNSFNHYSLGSVGQWIYSSVAGIDFHNGPESAGYKGIIIRPRPGGNLTYAQGTYKSMYGNIKSSWELKGNTFKLNISIPVNTEATVHIPGATLDSIKEGDKPISESKDINFLGIEEDNAVFTVGSGEYSFEVGYL